MQCYLPNFKVFFNELYKIYIICIWTLYRIASEEKYHDIPFPQILGRPLSWAAGIRRLGSGAACGGQKRLVLLVNKGRGKEMKLC